MEPYIEIAPGQSMALLPAQWDFIMAEERFVAFVGGVGSGKTVAGALKALRYAFAHPGCIGVIGAPNKTVLRDVTERTLRTLLPDGAIAADRKSESIIMLSNGSQLWLRSMDDFEHRRGRKLSQLIFWCCIVKSGEDGIRSGCFSSNGCVFQEYGSQKRA